MADYTRKQGQYLAFIYYYIKVNRQPPAEADVQHFFRTTASTVHQMILDLEEKGFISKSRGKAQSIEVLLPPNQLPDLG